MPIERPRVRAADGSGEVAALSVHQHFADRDPLSRIVLVEAERQFRRIIGYQQLAKLALAIERDLAVSVTTEGVATLVSA